MMHPKWLFFAGAFLGILCTAPVSGQNYPLYTNATTEHSEDYLAGNDYQKDFLLFLDLLTETHPAFAPGQQPPFDMTHIREEGYARMAKCRSALELQACLQSVASQLQDGHTKVLPDCDNDHIYPLGIFDDGSQVRLKATNRTYDSSLGKQITQINGYPVRQAIDSFRPLVSSDNEFYFRSRVREMMKFRSVWMQTPCFRPDTTLLLTFSDGSSIAMTAVSREELDIVRMQSNSTIPPLVELSNEPFSYTLLPEKSMCYLQFHACADRQTLLQQLRTRNPETPNHVLKKRLTQTPLFGPFLEEMFGAIDAQSIRTLVVDVRYNPGGNSRLCNQLLSWLKPEAQISWIQGATRVSPLWELHYPAQAAEYQQAFAKAGKPFETGRLYSDEELINPFSYSSVGKKAQGGSSKKQPFKGNVIFIQGAQTYSSAGTLLTIASDNRIGRIIGEPGSYRPSHYSDLLTWKLPHTQLKGIVSHRVFQRPDRMKDKELSLTPDVVLIPTWQDILQGTDPCTEWLKQNY